MNSDQQAPRTLPDTRRAARIPTKRFAGPFLAVMGYYAIAVGTFAAMAATSVPDGDAPFYVRCAIEATGVPALLGAFAAGRWWH
jgi:hypothetical protein